MEFKLKRNNDISYKITVKKKEEGVLVPVDITGWTFNFAVKVKPNDSDEDAIFPPKEVVASGADAVAGIVRLPIDAADTKNVPVSYYYCDVLVTDDQGKRKSSRTYGFDLQQEITDGDD